MSTNDFYLCVKSTIDKTMVDIVADLIDSDDFPNLAGAELDDWTTTSELLGSKNPMVVWQFLTLAPHPKDPLYQLQFLVGAKTVSDAGNYTLADLLMRLRQYFEVETTIQVSDFSGETEVPNKGYFIVRQCVSSPQQYDEQAGLRFLSISALGARTV